MTTTEYTEDLSSLLPALTLLQNMGYIYLPPSEALKLRGGKASACVLEEILTKSTSQAK